MDEGVGRLGIAGMEFRLAPVFCVGGGGNSGFQIINLLCQLQVAGIALLGVDMDASAPTHWHGPHWSWGGPSTVSADNMIKWRARLDEAAPDIRACGVQVVNISPLSALTAFERADPVEVITSWTR